MVLVPADLDDVEVALLGVLCVGLPPSRAAGDDRFRVDHVTAVVAGLRDAGEESRYLADEVRITEAFREQLRAFHAAACGMAPVLTPVEQARRDIALLTSAFRKASA